jgi:hypothetical protein
MSVNKGRPHVYVLPEDPANSSLANGFHLGVGSIRQMQVLPAAGGWRKVLDEFETVHVIEMDRCLHRFMVLVIDFDDEDGRLASAKRSIPDRLSERVFIVGARKEPEDLKRAGLGPYEAIGRALAADCRAGTAATWGHAELMHNANEVQRLRQFVRPILF